MISLYMVVEGATEEAFVADVLGPHLQPMDILPIAIPIHGIKPYGKVKQVALNLIREHARHPMVCTTMLDLYRLPDDFPGFALPGEVTDPYSRVKQIEDGFGSDIADPRFIPYIQLHEFEAILFADPAKFALQYPGEGDGIIGLKALAGEFGSPELINNNNPPSKRIRAVVPRYEKVAAGATIAAHIGLPTIRSKCTHFDQWLTRLESLSHEAS